MLRGLVEQGPGHAWKARVSYGFLQDALTVTASYAHYDTNLRGESHDAGLIPVCLPRQEIRPLTT